MIISTILNNHAYSFEVSLYVDQANQSFHFLILIRSYPFILAKKQNPGGVWTSVTGGPIDSGLLTAIFDAIDNSPAIELWETIQPISQMDKYYFDKIQA
jgi:hypothetical protein